MAFYARTILVTGPRDEVDPAAEAHRDHLRDLRARGKLLIAGEFANGDGFLEILDVVDLTRPRPSPGSPLSSSWASGAGCFASGKNSKRCKKHKLARVCPLGRRRYLPP